MSAFILACFGLVTLSGLFYLLPHRNLPREFSSQAEANLEWYRQRHSELGEDEEMALSGDMALRLLEDDTQPGAAAVQTGTSSSFPRWLLLPILGLSAGVLYFELGAAPDVIINKQLSEMSEVSAPQQLESLLQSIEARSLQRPENLHYTALLGRFYMNQQNYSAAAISYGKLALGSPGDAQAMAYAAQAEYLAAGRKLNDRAQLYAEQTLAVDPHQRTALGLLGMASFEQQRYRAALEYWQRLLAMEQEGSDSAKMISGVIERARQALQASGDDNVTSETAATESIEVTLGVTVHLSFPENAVVDPLDTVFLLARSADADSRMPVAVQRLQARQLPLSVRLDDSQSMAGQKLSALNSIVVVAQVSPSGRPGEASATWLGKAGPIQPTVDAYPIEIVLKPSSR